LDEIWVSLAVFLCLAGGSLGAMQVSPRMPARHRDEETNAVIRLVANIFVVLASLVFSLMINSARTSFETVDRSMHGLATEIILFDRALRAYGPEAEPARDGLRAYVERAIAQPSRADDVRRNLPDRAGQALDRIGLMLRAITPPDARHEALLIDARQHYRRLVEQRWTIVEQEGGSVPMPLIWLLLAWLTLVFASFGYRAPRNEVVVASFLSAALLIALAFYLVLDMDLPFHGPIQVSGAPLQRALAEMRQ
jgi:hypothetical protein